MIPMDSKLLFPKGCSLEQFLGGWYGTGNWEWAGVRYVARFARVGVGVRFTWLGNKPRPCWGEAFSTW